MPRLKKAVTAKILKATPTTFQAAIRDAAGAAVRAKNASGNKSTALADYAARSGFSGKTLRTILQLHGMEDMKRTDFLRELLMGFDLMGWGAQSDLFDDVATQLKAAVKAAEDDEAARQGKPKGTVGLPLDEAAKKFEGTAHLAPGAEAKATTASPAPNPTRKREREKAAARTKDAPTAAMRESTKAGDAHLRAQREGADPAFPKAPSMPEPANA